MDIQIVNAKRLDPETGAERPCVVGIEHGKIAFLGESLPAGETAAATVDANGALVTPGLVDFHAHLFTGGSAFGVNADLLIGGGVTLAVDMGTAGTAGYEALHAGDIAPRTLPVKAFLNLSPVGQPGSGISEPLNDAVINEARMTELIEKYRGEILGIKIRLSKEIVGGLEARPLARAVQLGEKFHLPVCVHTTNPPVPTDQIVNMLRPGDIYSHTYHKKGDTILNEDGKVRQAFKRAQERGVYLEVGNGRMNFNFEVAKAALADGLFPDIISSDSTAKTFANAPDMKDLVFVMSKFWNMGMPLADVIRSVTETPARAIGMQDEYGTLAVGRPAHVTLLRQAQRAVQFSDSAGNTMDGDKLLVPEMTMVRGRILYLQGGATLRK